MSATTMIGIDMALLSKNDALAALQYALVAVVHTTRDGAQSGTALQARHWSSLPSVMFTGRYMATRHVVHSELVVLVQVTAVQLLTGVHTPQVRSAPCMHGLVSYSPEAQTVQASHFSAPAVVLWKKPAAHCVQTESAVAQTEVVQFLIGVQATHVSFSGPEFLQ